MQCSLTDPPAANETVMASAGLTSIGGNEVDAGTLITLAPKTLYFGAGNYSISQPLNISRGMPSSGTIENFGSPCRAMVVRAVQPVRAFVSAKDRNY